jgi:hypothetical protein
MTASFFRPSFRRKPESSFFNPAVCAGLDPGFRRGDGVLFKVTELTWVDSAS